MDHQYQRWKEQFEAERLRLIDALGTITRGGMIEALEHIGATSVPGIAGSSCVDIGMAVHPFPLEAEPVSRLEGLGYRAVSGFETGPEQRFQHATGTFQLFLVESGAARWYDMLVLRDYLRDDEAARESFSRQRMNQDSTTSAPFDQTLPAAHRWWIDHHGFAPVEAVARELQGVSFPWYISGGWALDLFLGRVARMHHDVDVVIPYSAQTEVRAHLTERKWELLTPFQKQLEIWPPHMKLELPRHPGHAHREGEFIDVLLAEMDGVWHYRREPLVLRALERMGLKSESGIPYLAPELALLFKSRNTGNRERPKDQLDFEKILPHLEPERRAWLYWALVATSPDHPWIKQLI